MPMTLDSAPDIRPIEHDRGGEPPASEPGDVESTGLHGGISTIEDSQTGRSDDDLAEKPVRNFKDLGTDAPGEPPIRPWKDFGTDKDDVNEIRPLKDHLTDDYSGPVVPFGETADKAGPGPARELGQRAMSRASDALRPKTSPADGASSGLHAPEITPLSRNSADETRAAGEDHTAAAATGKHDADQHQASVTEHEDDAGDNTRHSEDDAALLAALVLPMTVMGASEGAVDDSSGPDQHDDTGSEQTGPDDEEPESPNDDGEDGSEPPKDGGDRKGPDDEEPDGEGESGGGDGRNDGGGKDGSSPEGDEPGDEDPDDDGPHEDKANDEQDVEGTGDADDERPRVPVQRKLEINEPARNDTEATPEGAEAVEKTGDEQAAIRARDEAHADNLADLEHLAKIASVHVTPGGNRNSRLHFELNHNGQDATEYLAELAGDMRAGSTDMPRVSNWREEIASPEHLKTGQIIEVASLQDLDELMARVGGWLNNDIRASRGSGAVLPPPVGNWQNNGYRPSALVGDVKDLRGKHFFGAQTNIEAMPLPKELQGHAPYTRYFTVSSQLKSTGKPPEASRPMRLVSVSALPIGYTSNNITARFAEIGRVPASVSAWLIDSHSRQTGHDVEYENRSRPIMIAKRR